MKITKKLIASAKAKMNELVKSGGYGFHRGSVAECMYCAVKDGVVKFIPEPNTACHAGVGNCCEGYGTFHKSDQVLFVVDNINTGRVSFGTKPQQIRFLQYLMDHPIFGQSFVEHDAAKAIKEGMMIRDLSKLPSNMCMFCLILTRAMWEDFQGKIVVRFNDLVDYGFSGDAALILSNYVKINNGVLTYSPVVGTGHNAMDVMGYTTETLKNFLNHIVKRPTKGTILEGVSYMSDGTNVFSVFGKDREKLLNTWVRDNIDNLKPAVEKFLGEKS